MSHSGCCGGRYPRRARAALPGRGCLGRQCRVSRRRGWRLAAAGRIGALPGRDVQLLPAPSGTCSHHGGVAVWLTGAPKPKNGNAAVDVGATVPLAPRTKTSRCLLDANPDRACSPGAHYSKLTKHVICSPSFHTGTIRNVPDSVKFAVEAEYGLKPGHYGKALEIDHLVSLELGGSNDIANLFPEKLNAQPGYRVKDRLENRLHALVCAGRYNLRSTQAAIARDWQQLYRQVYGQSP